MMMGPRAGFFRCEGRSRDCRLFTSVEVQVGKSNFEIRLCATLLASGLLAAQPAKATEGGASFYLLGSGGPGAALMPPMKGIYFDNTAYYYGGKAKADRPFLVGGNLVAGLDANIIADFPTVLWVPSTDILGGALALGGTLVLGHPDVKVEAVLTGPNGGQATVSDQDDALVVADPAVSAALGWTVGKDLFLNATTSVNVPIGRYRRDELANLAFHRWAVDTSVALTWHSVEAGWDASGKAGLTFNGTNHVTDYDTGTELHLEVAVERTFSPAFSAGALGYRFEQVSGDNGEGARLGPFKGKVSGIGATAAYNFQLGKTPATLRGRVLQEFGAKNRLEGTSAFLSLSFPIVMKTPPEIWQ